MKPAPIPACKEGVIQEEECTGIPMSYLGQVATLYFFPLI